MDNLESLIADWGILCEIEVDCVDTNISATALLH